MKRLLSVLMCLALTLALLPAAAEQASVTKPTVGQRLDAFLENLGSWLDEASEDVTQAAEGASEWTKSKWNDAKEKTQDIIGWLENNMDDLGQNAKDLTEKAVKWVSENWGGIEGWITETWSRIRIGSGTLMNALKERWENLKQDTGKYKQVLSTGANILIRESLLEYADYLEELAIEHQTAIPDDLKSEIDELRVIAFTHEKSETNVDEHVLDDFLASIGVDKDEFQKTYEERLKQRLIRVLITAENACLNEYLAEQGLSLSSAALRAQDRLNRYAAGTLDMTEEEMEKAAYIVTEWTKQAGIDEDEMALRILQYAENNTIQ